jgi:putative ABC transport system ATP-binding protein
MDHVRKSFEGGRIHALEDVSLRVEPGEFVALIGRSGCGKSTLLTLIGALDRPDAGTIVVDGTPLDRLDFSEYRANGSTAPVSSNRFPL